MISSKYENNNNEINIDEHLLNKKLNESNISQGKLSKNYLNYGLGITYSVKKMKNKILKS